LRLAALSHQRPCQSANEKILEEKIMVATKSEAVLIINKALETLEIKDLIKVVNDLHDVIVPLTKNESLRETMILLKEISDGYND